MPELPEVQTTLNGLMETVIGLKITDIWSDYDSAYFKGADNIKDRKYFSYFKREVVNAKIISASRRAKNILIHLNNDKTILIHMKMTGHLMYGKYEFDPKRKYPWIPMAPPSLKDPFNRHIRLMFALSNGKFLALCDSRKFAKITLIESGKLHQSEHLKDSGPEPLEKDFTFEKFQERLNLRPNGKIKQVIMDPKIIAGVGNIYADESLWRAGIHPLELVRNLQEGSRALLKGASLKALFKAIKQTLSKGIDFGGDSMSDYRNIHGERGRFQEKHEAYRRTGLKCSLRGCGGTIRRVMVEARSAHYCDRHQRMNN